MGKDQSPRACWVITAARCAAAVAIASAANEARGAVVLDGSLGGGSRAGPNFTVPYEPGNIGVLKGTNLFHSFQQFDVARSESVTFTNPSGATITNIFARVTGGSVSRLNGAIVSDIAGANLIFINPSGVILGPHASFTLTGTFAVATANSVHLADGGVFRADLAKTSVLTTASPSAFGFLAAPAPVTLLGNIANVPGSVSLVGGSVQIIGGSINVTGGRVNLVSAASAGRVQMDPTNAGTAIDVSGLSRRGDIELTQGARVLAPVGGKVVVRGGTLTMDRSTIDASTDVVKGQGVDVAVDGAASVIFGRISSQAAGAFHAGPIHLSADSLVLQGTFDGQTGSIDAGVTGTGHGADISLTVGALNISQNGDVTATTHGGDAGSITVNASRSILLDGRNVSVLTGIADESEKDAIGNGGNITIATPSLQMIGAGEITSTTKSAGAAGTIRVTAGILLLDSRHAPKQAQIQARVGTGNGQGASGQGGQVFVQAGSIQFLNRGVISATTFGSGDAGAIQVNAAAISMSGPAGGQTGIFARSASTFAGAGKGGDIAVNAGTLNIGAGAQIAANTIGPGNGGALRVNAGMLRLAAGGSITSASTPTPGMPAGDAGDIFVSASNAAMLHGGGTVSTAAPASNGGNIHLFAPLFALNASTITGRAGGNGAAITIDAADPPDATIVTLGNGSVIDGIAGGMEKPVTIGATELLLSSDSRILTDKPAFTVDTDVAGRLAAIRGALLTTGSQLVPQCANVSSELSSFVITGRDGLPPAPDGWLTFARSMRIGD